MEMLRVLTAEAQQLRMAPKWLPPVAIHAFLIAMGVLLVVPALLGPPMLHDSFAIGWVWIDQFTAEIARGNLYPRWLPLSNGGLGAPVFYYYPPLAFYAAAMFGLVGFSTYASMIATFAASFALSGISAWHWLKDRSRHPLLGALVFMAAPYHLFDFTRRGALAECLAIALIPLVAIGLRRVAEGRGSLLLAFSYAAMICAHLPLALLTSVLLIAPYAFWHRRRLPGFAIGTGLGIGITALYLLPALALEEHRDVAKLYQHDFLNPSYWSPWTADFSVGFVLDVYVIMAALAAMSLMLLARRWDPWALGAIAVLVVSAGLIPQFWSVPLLANVQFPYRAVPIAEFALATAIARSRLRPPLLVALVPLMYLSASAISQPNLVAESPLENDLRARHPDVYEYLPKGVIGEGEVHFGQVVLVPTRLDEILRRTHPVPRVPGKVIEPVFYFPAWSCGGAHPKTKLLMRDPACAPRIVWTRREWIGAMISVMSLLVAVFLGLSQTVASAGQKPTRLSRRWTIPA